MSLDEDDVANAKIIFGRDRAAKKLPPRLEERINKELRTTWEIVEHGWTAQALIGLLGLISSPIDEVSQPARAEFLDVLRSRPEQVLAHMRSMLEMRVTQPSRARALRLAQKHAETATVQSSSNGQKSVSVGPLLATLQSERSSLHLLIDTSCAWVLVAKVAPPVPNFKAVWLESGSGLHFLIVNASRPAEEVAQSTIEILGHFVSHFRPEYRSRVEESDECDISTSPEMPFCPAEESSVRGAMGIAWDQTRGSEEDGRVGMTKDQKMADESIPKPKQASETQHHIFALAQTEVETEEKRLVAEWVVDYFPLYSGAGILLDAGSSVLELWKQIEARMGRGLSNLVAFTNSLQVLSDWCENIRSPAVRETTVELLGNMLDPAHQAFYYGRGLLPKLDSQAFRPINVYIGTSGIEFDEREGVFFGYHGGDAEREFKEMLFQCYARKRIILATPKKIGRTGGRVFNLLAVPDISTLAPIYLVTTKPPPQSEEEAQLERAKKVFESNEVQQNIRRKNLEVHLVVLSRDPNGRPIIADPTHDQFVISKGGG